MFGFFFSLLFVSLQAVLGSAFAQLPEKRLPATHLMPPLSVFGPIAPTSSSELRFNSKEVNGFTPSGGQ